MRNYILALFDTVRRTNELYKVEAVDIEQALYKAVETYLTEEVACGSIDFEDKGEMLSDISSLTYAEMIQELKGRELVPSYPEEL